MNRYRATLAAIALFLALALLLTWPLPRHLATHAPGDGSDDPAILWNLWWVRYSLTELGQSPFESAWMFWPIGINLIFYTLTTLNGLLSIPIQLVFGIIAANSFVVYFELVIAALGAWLLARWVLAQHPDAAPASRRQQLLIAGLAAIVYAFSSSKWLYLSLGQFNIASSHWLPWAVLYLGKMWVASNRREGVRAAVLCAIFTLMTGWTEFTYASFFIQFAALFWLIHVLTGWRQGERQRVVRFTLLSALLGLLFLIGMSPILALMLADMRLNGDFLVEGLGFADVFSNDLLGFIVPGNQHPLLGERVGDFGFAYLNFAFLGWVTAALALVGALAARTRRYATPWLLTAGIFGLLSLGPTLRIGGRSWELPLPFDLLLQIPILKANRYPSRYSVLIALSLAILVAWGASALVARRRGRAATGLLAGVTLLVLAEHLGAPLPLTDYRPPAVYRELRDRPGEALLELPLAWRNGFRVTGTIHPAFMLAQAHQRVHEKRLLSGNTSRNPEIKFQYFTELPVIDSLIALETGHELPPGRERDDAALAPELLRLLDTPSIVIRRLSLDVPFPVYPAATLPYIEKILPTTRWYERGEYVGLEVPLPDPPDRVEFDGGAPLARLYVAEGWSALPPRDTASDGPVPLYAEQPEARLLLPSIASDGTWQLTLDTWLPSGLEGSVELLVADPAGGGARALGRYALGGPRAIEIELPPTARHDPLTELILRFDRLYPPGRFVAEHPDATLPVSILVESAQEESGKFAHIYVNGTDVTGTGSGYHAALISPAGELLGTMQVNPLFDPGGAARLAAFIDASPEGTIVALAAEDTVGIGRGNQDPRLHVLGDELFDALERSGASAAADMRGRHRWSHAFVGVRGAAPGEAASDASPIRPARLWLGPPLSRPTIGMRLDRVTIEPLR